MQSMEIKIGDTIYHADKGVLVYNYEKKQGLSGKLKKIFECLIDNKYKMVPKEDLFAVAYEDEPPNDCNLYSLISKLRGTLRKCDQQLCIENEYGRGYRLYYEVNSDAL
ncbi:helix-turn-helix domain-containing protein [Chitinophaga silvatica]|uniref:Helix-turn-helix domain-containing protein n=1 Tax=Chitinophaga silvatica TaxID=2282649 RepID=A0A3E1Y2A6_9BACT|nr:helix-turn-helix domain-containing protein [Chitinophaga silvatica]RFS18657.1 helix-turn-helix domain-containing protein [Chitinophaga silvatica]